MATYAQPADLIAQYDSRTIGDLVYDQGGRVSESALATDPKVAAALSAASGKLEAALLHGGRYQVSDLTGLTGNTLGYLKYLTCLIAFDILWERRPWGDDRQVAYQRAEEALELLRSGKNCFNVVANIQAGEPSTSAGGPSVVAPLRGNYITDACRGNFYPGRRPWGAW